MHLGFGTRHQISNLYGGLPRWLRRGIDGFRSQVARELRSPIIEGAKRVLPEYIRCSCGHHDTAQLSSLGLSGRRIVFVYDPLTGPAGSRDLRVFQSARRVASAFPDCEVLTCAKQSRRLLEFRDGILILGKRCHLSNRRQSRLATRGNLLIADLVDEPHGFRNGAGLRGYICASFTEFMWLQNHLKIDQERALVLHAPNDAFLTSLENLYWTRFAVGYYGESLNGLFVTELSQRGVLEVSGKKMSQSDGSLSPDWVSDASSVPVQYIARPSARTADGRFKPFNKGFQSAQLGQLVIGGRFDVENRYWLGDEYPFYVEEESIDAAAAAIRNCQRAWEDGEVGAATTAMLRLRQVSCPVQNALDYRDAFILMSR